MLRYPVTNLRLSLGQIGVPREMLQPDIDRYDRLRQLAEQIPDPDKKAEILALSDSAAESYGAVQAYVSDALDHLSVYDIRSLKANNTAVQALLTAATTGAGLAVPEDVIGRLKDFKGKLNDERQKDADTFASLVWHRRLKAESTNPETKKEEQYWIEFNSKSLNDLGNTILFYRREIDRLINALPKEQQGAAREAVKEVPLKPTPPPRPLIMAGSSLGQASDVICEDTAEGGRHCSDGKYYPPGSSTPVSKAFPWVPVGIGAALLGGVLWVALK